jgi:hypothetical protein
MLHESRVEAKKQQMMLLLVMGSPTFGNPSDRRSWNEQSKKVFSQYVNLLMGIEVSQEDMKEEEMVKFYEEVVKKSAPTMSKDRDGKLSVTGVAEVFGL